MQFSKKDTSIIKGVAILFLLAYHCFSSLERLNGSDISFYPLPQKTAFYIFDAMNICVGMFSFLSAYGLTKTVKFKNPDLELNVKESTKFVTKRTISLLGAFFIPYVLCTAATFIFVGYNPYGEGIKKVINIIIDMLGLAGLLHTPMLIGTWWYMSFALAIIFLIPFTISLYKRFGILAVMPYVLVPIIFNYRFNSSEILTNMTRWLLTIPLGVIFADCDLLVKFKSSQFTKNKGISKLLKFVTYTAVLLILVHLRQHDWCKEKFFYFISNALPVFTVYYVYEFITDIPILNGILDFLGKHSSNMFFMHTFIRAVWFPNFTYSFKYAVLTYLFMLVFSLALSFAVEGIKKIIKWDKAVKKLTDVILKRQDRLYFNDTAIS